MSPTITLAPPITTKSLARLIAQLPRDPSSGLVEEFGLFLDTHRDQPHIGTLTDDLHRGYCNPTMVAFDPSGPALVGIGRQVMLHPKHMFIDPEWFSTFLLQRLMNGEGDPRDKDGKMPTRLLRDSRTRIYHLWTFRQAVLAKHGACLAAGTLVR